MRTVHRDMDALSAAGVPVYALRGAQGGWQLDDDWRTQVPGLDDAELRALLMSQPRVTGDLRLAAAESALLESSPIQCPSCVRAASSSLRANSSA